jgi:hypothetical protein
MVIQNSQWMAPSRSHIRQREMPFEVHLPKRIWKIVLKADRCRLLLYRSANHTTTMTLQDGIDGAVVWTSQMPRQQLTQLTAAPVGVLQVQG